MSTLSLKDRVSDHDLRIMALTVFGEARGESAHGQYAVAWVIRNRFENPGWWSRQPNDGIPDDTLAAVCRDPYQFSCWNPENPNRRLLELPKTLERSDFLAILKICTDVIAASSSEDMTHGADHYCRGDIVQQTRWARNRKPTAVIGSHHFFKIRATP